MSKPKYLILDLETDGLHPDVCTIVEVAVIAVDTDLNELGRFESVVGYRQRGEVDPFVVKMHNQNGLWLAADRAYGQGVTISSVDNAVGVWLDRLVGRGNKLIMAGGSPGAVDVPFTTRYMPRLRSWLSHRTVDISGLAREAKEVGFNVPTSYNVGNPLEEHRAMPDCVAELELWRTVRREQRAVLRERVAGGVDF